MKRILSLIFPTILCSTFLAAQPPENAWEEILWMRTTLPTADIITGGITPDGKGVVVGVGASLPPGETRLFDLKTGLLLWRIPTFQKFSRYNSRANTLALLTREDREKVEVWDVGERRLISTFRGEFGEQIFSLALSDNGRYVAAAGSDSTLQIYDIVEKRFVRSWRFETLIWSLHLSPSGRYLFGVPGRWGPEGKGWLLDVETGELIKNFRRTTFWPTDVNVAFSPDERYLALCGSFADRDYGVSIYSVPDCTPVREYFGSDDEFTQGDYWSFHAVTFSPDGTLLAGRYKPTRSSSLVWDVETGERRDSIGHRGLTDPDMTVYDIGRDNRTMLMGSITRGRLNVWDIEQDSLIADYFDFSYHWHQITQVRFSGSGKFIAAGFYAGNIGIYDAETGDTLLNIPHTRQPIWSVNGLDISPDDSLIAVAGRDSLLTFYASSTGERLRVSANLGSPAGLVEFLRDGRMVATASEEGITLFTTQDLEPALTIPEPGTPLFALSPDGTELVSVSGTGRIRLWDAGTGSFLREIGEQEGTQEVVWSPDGKFIALCKKEGSIHVWDAQTGNAHRHWRHDALVNTIRFSPDSKFLVSGGEDSTMRVWSIEQDREVYRYTDFPIPITRLEISPDGSQVITASTYQPFDFSLTMWNREWPTLSVKEHRVHSGTIELLSITPHPASNACRLHFSLTAPADIIITLHNVLGQQVRTLKAGWLKTGEHDITINTTDLLPGVYHCRIQTGDGRKSTLRFIVQ